MRISHIISPILIVCLIACKNKQAGETTLRVPGFDQSTMYDKADSLYDIQQYDSAYLYFKLIAINSTSNRYKAAALTFMGIIQRLQGDFAGAMYNYKKSLSLLDERDTTNSHYLHSNFSEFGNISIDQKNYKEAVGYFSKALKYEATSTGRMFTLNDLATAYQKTGNYEKAVNLYESIIDSVKYDPSLYAMTLSNLARTRWLQDHHYPPTTELQALSIRKSIKDNRGLNASYAHLSDYYEHTRPDSALYYAKMMYTVAKDLNSPDDELEALDKLAHLNPITELKPITLRYIELNDSLQEARRIAQNQFALVRYDVEENEKDKLELQKTNAQITAFLIIGLLAATAIIMFISFRSRKRKQQLEEKARLQQLKTSQRVHDVVANGLYGIMTELEHKESIDKEPLMDKIEILYERSRDISYEPSPTIHHNFQSTISALKTTFASPGTNIYLTGNNQETWNRIPTKAQGEIEQVLQELMVNMKKHSQAENVVLKIESHPNNIQIHYKDDGLGIPSSKNFGNGLTNTETRINGIGGTLTFEPTNKGLHILITIPTVSTT